MNSENIAHYLSDISAKVNEYIENNLLVTKGELSQIFARQ
jgi:hypothetical protein